ncbi:MAG: hypothetical protein ABH834_05835 [Candidatus Altiarchaeota archaeon]
MKHAARSIIVLTFLALIPCFVAPHEIWLTAGWNLISFPRDLDVILDWTAPTITYSNDSEQSGVTVNRSWIYVNVVQFDANYSQTVFRLYNTSGLVDEARIFNITETSVNWSNLSRGTYFYNVTAYDLTWNHNSTETRNITLYAPLPQWHETIRVDSANGSRPRFFHSPNNTLWLFYDVGEGINEELVLRKRIGAQFGNETEVYSKLRMPYPLFLDEENILLSGETGGSVFILNTTDSGETWQMIKYYAAHDGSYCSASGGSALTSYNNTIHLFYDYVYYNAVFGCVSPRLYWANQTNNVWAQSGSNLGVINSRYVHSARQQGENILVFSSTIVKSSDNAASFTTDTNMSFYSVKQTADGTLYGVQIFTQGIWPNETQILAIYNSSDFGDTWSQIINFTSTEDYYYPCLGVSNQTIGSAFGRRDVNNLYNISVVYTNNGGETWIAEEDLIVAPDGYQIGYPSWNMKDAQLLDCIAEDGRFTLAYYLSDSYDGRDGVYLTEYY